MRDVLKGTLRWSQNLLDADEISINFNHYKADSSVNSSTDSSPELSTSTKPSQDKTKTKEKHLFYVSSEENSEAVDSPIEPASSASLNKILKLASNIDVELEELKTSYTYRKKMGGRKASGPNNCESDFSLSWSPETESVHASPDSEESPNPLYRIRHSSYDN